MARRIARTCAGDSVPGGATSTIRVPRATHVMGSNGSPFATP